LEKKHPSLNPYNFVANSPLIFVDPDGNDNIIYLVALASAVKEGLSKADMLGIVEKANENYKKLGLNTRVQLFDEEVNGVFNENFIDKNDSYVLLGSTEEIAERISNQKNHSESAANITDPEFWTGGVDNPEISVPGNLDYNDLGQGIFIDASDAIIFGKSFKAEPVEMIAFIINHGSAHNSNGSNHDVIGGICSKGQSIYTSIMYGGSSLDEIVADKDLNKNVIQGNLNSFGAGAGQNYSTSQPADKSKGTQSHSNYNKNKQKIEANFESDAVMLPEHTVK